MELVLIFSPKQPPGMGGMEAGGINVWHGRSHVWLGGLFIPGMNSLARCISYLLSQNMSLHGRDMYGREVSLDREIHGRSSGGGMIYIL